MPYSSTELVQAARKATAWLASMQTDDGAYKGLEAPNADGVYEDTDDLGCYYKSIYSLRVAGEAQAAGRGMMYTVKRFMDDQGDFYNTPECRSAGSYGPVYCQLYSNAWLMRGASALRWYGLSKQILDFMLRYRTDEGGFYAQVTPPTDVVDSNATAVGGLCCILGGKPELAIPSAGLLLTMLDAQPDANRLYTRWRDGQLLTDPGDTPEKQHKYWFIDLGEGEQAYWIWAWPMNFLLAVHELTGEKKYFDAALGIWEKLWGGHDDAFHFVTAGKGGWGSSMLYRMTGDEKFYQACQSQMDFILSHQHADGYMLDPGKKDLHDQPIRTTYDYTADFVSWLVDSAAELGAMGK